MSAPRVVVIGYGMAGIGAVHALLHAERFTASDVRAHITVIEGLARPGGKAAPDNLGAQFLDAEPLSSARRPLPMYPFDRLLDDLDVKTHAAREDYELVRLRLKSKVVVEPATFASALATLREAMFTALVKTPFVDLDKMTVHEILQRLRNSEVLSAEGMAAMRQRMLLEDGTVKLSALAYALSLAKTPSPVRRLEIRGGMYRVAARARDEALTHDVVFGMGRRVRSIEVAGDGVRVWSRFGGEERVDRYDAAILCVSPEHLRDIEVSGYTAPLEALRSMEPARITKSNLALKLPVRGEEHATERYAMWFSPNRAKSEVTATFFHGWDGSPALSEVQMLKAALGSANQARLMRFASRTWDAAAIDDDSLPMGYISEPRVGQCVPMLRASRDLYFKGAHDASALQLASHALGIGGSVREAVLSGEWAVTSLFRSWGHDVAPAFARIDDPERELYGASSSVLARELDG